MKKRVFSTNAGDRIEATTAEAVSSRTNVGLTLTIRSAARSDAEITVLMTPKESTRFEDWMHEVDGEVWADEMGECEDHELTSVRCQNCGRYCGTKKRCPHCQPRSK